MKEQFHLTDNGLIVVTRALKKKIGNILTRIARDHKIKIDKIDVILLHDQELLELNQQYLNHDYFTDIITFDYSDSDKEIIADLFISMQRVEENATFYSVAKEVELLRVIIHGVLHLCGYGDHTNDEKFMIRDKEDFYLGKA
jgi:probable rRNA maturation factor